MFKHNKQNICEVCSKLTVDDDFEHVIVRWNTLLPSSKFINEFQSRILGAL